MTYLFTSESVSEGHPDKLCDQVSDAILDATLAQDKNARVACETLAKTGVIIIAGEISSHARVDYETIVRNTVCNIGYNSSEAGFDGQTCAVINMIGEQSPDIAQGVDQAHTIGAGDQGLMFGFACKETPTLMPAPIYYAHELIKQQSKMRRSEMDFLRPDAKSQVTLRYDEQGKVVAADAIVLSTQHKRGFSQEKLKSLVLSEIIHPVFPKALITSETKIHINPTGVFEVGGPVGDCGLTGRKIIVDTYGGYAHHGGGAFSGKDPTKVDRSAAYMARYIAKNLVQAGIADKCEIQLSYAIGVAEPVSVAIDTFGTSAINETKLASAVREVFNLTPQGIIESLNLLNTHYAPTATYGHFGRTDIVLPWEKTDKTADLQAALS